MQCSDHPKRNKVQHDLFFTDAGREENFGYIGLPDIRHESLHPAWYAFQHSVESIRTMAVLPQAVVSAAVNHLLPLAQATFNITGKPVLEDSDLSHEEDIGYEYSKIVDSFFEGRDKIRRVISHDLVMYNKWNLVNSELTRGGFFAILEAQVVGMWAAFSVLTTELCVAAVNARPTVLFNVGDRAIKLKSLLQAGGNSDWSGRMGELMRLFVHFDSYENTADAYRLLFRDAPAIVNAIQSPIAKTVCLVRTQLAHDGGIVTDSFLKQAKAGAMKPWHQATVGQRLPLDGRNVGDLCRNLIDCANALVRAVDDWLMRPAKEAAKSAAGQPEIRKPPLPPAKGSDDADTR